MAWLSGWNYRKAITIDSSLVDADLTDFPVLTKLTTNNFDFSKALSTGYDIRFTSDDGTTLLAYERECHDSTNSLAEYWVKIPSVLSASDTTIFCYYGNPDATDGADPTNVWDSNFKGVWHLNQDPSGTAPQEIDSTANNNDGTSNGSMTSDDLVEGQIDGALDFDGSDDYVDCGADSSLNMGTGEFSIAFCFSVPDQTNNYPEIIATKGGWEAGSFGIRYDNSGYPNQITIHWNIEGDPELATANTYAINTWHHVVVVRSGNSLKVYVDGIFDNSSTPSADSAVDLTHGGGMYIGNGITGDGANAFFKGSIDELRISNIARSPAYIKASFNSGNDSLLTFGAESAAATLVSNLFDCKIIIKDVYTDLLDGKAKVRNSAVNLLDGKVSAKDSVVNSLDGMIDIKNAAVWLLDGKTDIKDSSVLLLDSKTNIKDSAIKLFNGKTYIISHTTNFLDGKVILANKLVNALDGKVNVKDALISLFDGKTRIKNSAIDSLDGLVNVSTLSTNFLDGRTLIKSSLVDFFDGKAQLRNSNIKFFDGKTKVIFIATNLLDGKATVSGSPINLLDGKANIIYHTSNFLDGKVCLTYKTIDSLDGKVILISEANKLNLLDGKINVIVRNILTSLLEGKLVLTHLYANLYSLNYNILSKGTTQYVNYDFTSMIKFGDSYLGCNNNGIFKLDGTSDNGRPIDSWVKPLTTDFGISNPKKCRAGYIGYETQGELDVRVQADEGIEYVAILPVNSNGQQGKKFPLPRDIKGRYITFTILNVNGCDFGIDSMDVCLIVTPHKL